MGKVSTSHASGAPARNRRHKSKWLLPVNPDSELIEKIRRTQNIQLHQGHGKGRKVKLMTLKALSERSPHAHVQISRWLLRTQRDNSAAASIVELGQSIAAAPVVGTVADDAPPEETPPLHAGAPVDATAAARKLDSSSAAEIETSAAAPPPPPAANSPLLLQQGDDHRPVRPPLHPSSSS